MRIELNSRRVNLSKRCEEYLEAIYILEKKLGRARIKDIAEKLSVKPSSVVEYLRRMCSNGLIDYKPGREVKLTEKGFSEAEKIYEKHKLIKSFLVSLGVSEETAEKDSCIMEHYLSRETFEKIAEYIKRTRPATSAPEVGNHSDCSS